MKCWIVQPPCSRFFRPGLKFDYPKFFMNLGCKIRIHKLIQSMKRVSILFLFSALLTLSSCLNLIEELALEKDGSGKYAITFDMSSMFSDPMMKGLIEETIRQQSGTMPNLFAEMDTVVYFKDAPEVQKLLKERPGFWENVRMKMKVSEARKEMVATLQMDFKELSDIDYFLQKPQ